MKSVLLYLLIPIMLLQSNMTLLICTSFYYNQNYIEKYYCVQRSMLNNSCHGQCYLMKKLKSQQEREQENFKVHFHEADIKLPVYYEIKNPNLGNTITVVYSLYKSTLHPILFNNNIFHPPIYI